LLLGDLRFEHVVVLFEFRPAIVLEKRAKSTDVIEFVLIETNPELVASFTLAQRGLISGLIPSAFQSLDRIMLIAASSSSAMTAILVTGNF